ncbi:dephospho-CoA kinase [Candidatus Persebacteraceae bacterium Df01]|uniref:Dephospho-CoA kinase n=1 Tax=Candidatus Doriopsillibacter californiensis TaxID=2970740 RepID=A0ABT7QNF0_9GAMM|nr:dephospho-CoA kinase [Candidatus Persebacteraceae bacterium Df01]
MGLTGGLASGKSEATSIFSALGATVIDADETGRRLTTNGGSALPALRHTLGAWAFDNTGNLRRHEVRQRVFSDLAMRTALQKTLHPLIEKDMRRQMAAVDSSYYLILSVPLLFETDMFTADCHRVAVTDCEPTTQIARACRRDKISELEAKSIIATQLPRGERLARADDIIHNDADLAALRQAVENCHHQYIKIAPKERIPT